MQLLCHPSRLISGSHAKELAGALKNAKRCANLDEEAEAPELTGTSPRRVVQRTDGAVGPTGPAD
eukprot:4862981-Lingulodinium_polyedra.AAC.1